jgi:hypothetical protein
MLAMTHRLVTKILSLAAMVMLLTVAVLIAVPKNTNGKLSPQFHAAGVR